MKTARKVATRAKVSRVATPLTLAARVERLEKIVLLPQEPQAAARATAFTNLGADGRPTAGEHVAVLQRSSGLIWTAGPLQGGKDMTHEDAVKAVGALDLLAHRDWRLPTIQELLSLIDYERYDPAADPAHFKGPYGWTWSSTLVKGQNAPAGFARGVGLHGGGSDWGDQGNLLQALAVRASQQLGLLG